MLYQSNVRSCGYWVNNVGSGSRYDGSYQGYTGPVIGSCDYWDDYTQWNQSTIDSLLTLTMGSMDALQNWFFWTWKIANSTSSVNPNPQVNPFWHYRLGLANGWITPDPRKAAGSCASQGVTGQAFDGTFPSPYMTGGAGAGTIVAAQTASYPWPVSSLASVGGNAAQVPQYTQTRAPITLPAPTFTSPGSTQTINAGNGWFNPNDDSRMAYTAIGGCNYPAEYSAGSVIPTSPCGAGLTQPTKRSAEAQPVAFPAPTAGLN